MRSAQQWLQDDNTFATSALVLVLDKFGTDFIQWDPITASMEFRQEFGFEPSENLQDKLQALSSILTSNLFHVSLETFSTISNVLNMSLGVSELFLPADLDACLWGVTESKLLEGREMAEDFSHNIARYVGFLLSEQGFTRPPSILRFAEYPEHEDMVLQDAFVDDPVTFKVYWDRQQEEKNELERYTQLKIQALFQQLEKLPVKGLDRTFLEQTLVRLRQESAPAA